jgi:hypothetical protein
MFLQAAGTMLWLDHDLNTRDGYIMVYPITTGKRRKGCEALAKWNARRLPSGNLTYMENMNIAH